MNYKNLFLRQSYFDNYDTYISSLKSSIKRPQIWDYIILTASNESQAESYRRQIEWRIEQGVLPSDTHYAVLPDFEGKRVGSGGATLGVLKYIRERENSFDSLRILVIHSGGDSKRVPQYSACGKLFSPVPRELPDGRRSTLFDEFIIGMSGVPSRLSSGGMLVLSGDVLLLFNPLQIDFYGNGAAALSIGESVDVGKDHGVFLKNKNGCVERFLHKQSTETLKAVGAVNDSGKVNIDTGAILLSTDILNDLYSLVDTDEKFRSYVNETVRLSFYADFVYPLAQGSTLEEFYTEKPEGELNDELLAARKVLWDVLHKYSMKLICFAPASFLHFGTCKELLALVTDNIDDYRFLNWSKKVSTNEQHGEYACYNSYIDESAVIDAHSYIEDSFIEKNVTVGNNCIISGCTLENVTVPDNTALHTLKLENGKFVCRMWNIDDNPKENLWMGKKLNTPLWDAELFGEFESPELASKNTLSGVGGQYSLKSSFNSADSSQIIAWGQKLDDKIRADLFLDAVHDRVPVEQMTQRDITPRLEKYLLEIAKKADFSEKIRIYYALGQLTGHEELTYRCFDEICSGILSADMESVCYRTDFKICADEKIVRLPVRVNFGGGWSDTPPYCNEKGGKVLNAAITLEGKRPIVITLKKLDKNCIALSSTDNGSYNEFTDIAALQDCNNPSDAFALHKAALIACGVIPYKDNISVDEICNRLGGGFLLNTEVLNIPKGSGLGTSSILSGACVKGIYEFFGAEVSENDIYDTVLCMEQIMSTGGGWQDQVGGLCAGFKMVYTEPGLKQNIMCRKIELSDSTKKELQERFVLIYTGQRRLARNLLREVVGKYVGNDEVSLDVLAEIQELAEQMACSLQKGDIDGFAKLLNAHWEQSKRLDKGCTNTCIDQIFNSVEDLIDGKMICGAGGGGFVQVVLKKGVTKKQISDRLIDVFADSGVEVYNSEFVY